MKLNDLLIKYKDNDIIDRVILFYPSEKKNRKGYEDALKELRNTKPLRTTSKIIIEKIKDKDGEWIHVTVTTGKNDYSASFIKWGEFLNMKIIPNELSGLDNLAHCIWEMTFYGYSDKSTQKELEKLVKVSKEAEKDIKAGKTGKFKEINR